jgi:RNA polymerase sigma-70 factor (ECF subfamily)
VQDAAVVTDPRTNPAGELARAVYDEVHARLWRSVLAWSGSADVADDATAEAFAQLLRRGDGVRDPAAWVWRAAFRIAGGEMARRRRDASSRPVPEVGRTLPEPALDLIAALRTLSEQQRACVALAYIADLPATEVARTLGTTAAVVRVQLMRARRRLRDLLGDEEDRDG